MPRISVILPVYNSQAYLNDALQSLLMQTYQDFEVIAINDGSKDQSGELLERFQDKRIKIIHQENQGLAKTLNIGIHKASGEFIARQDADDISLPLRLEKQIEYLDQYPNCGLLGTHAHIWKENIKTRRMIQHPIDNVSLQLYGLFNCLFVHSSVIARTEMMINAGLYPSDPERNPPEDFDLWLRMMQRCEVANLATPLLIYREVATGITQTKMNVMQARTHRIACENLALILNDQNAKNYNDLVASMRFDAENLFRKPNWNVAKSSLNGLENYLQQRFQFQSEPILKNILNLKSRLNIMKLSHEILGRSALAKSLKTMRMMKRWLNQS